MNNRTLIESCSCFGSHSNNCITDKCKGRLILTIRTKGDVAKDGRSAIRMDKSESNPVLIAIYYILFSPLGMLTLGSYRFY